MRNFFALILSLLICFQTSTSGAASNEVMAKDEYINDITNRVYLYEVLRYLYRWYLDEIDIEKNCNAKVVECLIRPLNPKLDAGDESKYAEIIIPAFDIVVKVKKADYRVEELNQTVKSNGYRIVNVSRASTEGVNPSECTKVNIDIKKLRDYLFKTRNMEEFPSSELLARMRKAMKKQVTSLRKYDVKDSLSDEKEQNVIHIAPISPIGNDVWAYWESGKVAIHCNSDIDIANKEVWDHDELYFHFYDVFNNTVVSLSETALSNEYLTRDQVGRILFNCMILGKRIVLAAPK